MSDVADKTNPPVGEVSSAMQAVDVWQVGLTVWVHGTAASETGETPGAPIVVAPGTTSEALTRRLLSGAVTSGSAMAFDAKPSSAVVIAKQRTGRFIG
ncbi:hypothetical protein [Nocardioides donggukensis]|uniref:Uncharacterized protein n=1 Tax=Nocardioides donggukensis TaxID=2774019 RepID=A0A927KA49_9ACTN|nr:hypothetical protein [Nocardioides donggukensis]MBD8870566.1 hypothetical protein [Nocardioides donggukensis]